VKNHKFYLKNESVAREISLKGHQRFLKEHNSKIRLKKILEQI
jgi:spore maturation protein CgeB